MTYQGHVENGMVVLDESPALPEGAKVELAVLDAEASCEDDESLPTLYEQFRSFIGIAKGLPSDLALNHDHYLHGQPKR